MTGGRIVTIDLCILLAMLCVLSGPAQTTSAATPTARFLSAALKDQEVKCGPSLEVDYQVEFHPIAGGRASVTRWSYKRTPEIVRAEREIGFQTKTICTFDRKTEEFRTLTTSPRLVEGRVSVGLWMPITLLECLETTNFHLPDGRLVDCLTLGKVSKQTEKIDGHSCWRVDIPSKSRNVSRYVVWVDPVIGYNPRRIDLFWVTEKPETITFTSYKSVEKGVWFPEQSVHRYVNSGKDYIMVISVSSLTAGRVIPKDQLRLEFPSGTAVSIRGVTVTMP